MNRKISTAVTLLLSGTAYAATPTAAISCNPCSDINALQQAAGAWASAHATTAGTILLVHSLNSPISGFFRIVHPPKMGGYAATKITLDNMSAAQLDNAIFARANKHEHPIDAPQQYTAIESTISLEIEKTLVPDNTTAGMNLYHLLVGFPHVEYWGYFDKLWNVPFDNYIGDTVTVNYPDGFSEKWEFQGADKTPSHRWTRVPGTLLRFGKPYNSPTSQLGTPLNGFSTTGGYDYWNSPGNVETRLDSRGCYGTSSITVTAPNGDSTTSYGLVIIPC